MNSPKQGVSDLPEILYRHGMRNVVISPGSRNAPLIFSFTGHDEITCYSITDERAAAYFALGISLQTKEPVGLICTSGTAVLNFAPAIAEAYYQNIPLVVMTADRPGEWIDQGDGQTIRQRDIYQNYIKQSFELPVETVHEADLIHFNRSANNAINTALAEPLGPVHVNIPLREPLYAPLPVPGPDLRIINNVAAPTVLSSEIFSELSTRWNASAKILVILGAEQKNKYQVDLCDLLSSDPSVVVIAENISNSSGEKVIASPERFFGSLAPSEGAAFQPDLLVTIGNSVVSGRLKKYLRQYAPAEHWHIQPSPSTIDTYQSLTHSICATPEVLLQELVANRVENGGTYRDITLHRDNRIQKKHQELINTLPYSDLVIYDTILKNVPLGSNLHLANSTPIRYAQLFASRRDINYHSNRGTSGIDGCISTAAGFAVSSTEITTLITGDLSFIYDSNGLWNKYLTGNFKIIVINNGGGNIFRLIDGGGENNLAREFLETPHQVNIQFLAGAFGANHAICKSKEELPKQLEWLYTPAKSPSILEIITDADINTTVFKEYYKQIKIV
jgi:2-succinyl-5-enolpyruvyl-6-hydroxy-3-cyclohexene-1-carboxylate synthase